MSRGRRDIGLDGIGAGDGGLIPYGRRSYYFNGASSVAYTSTGALQNFTYSFSILPAVMQDNKNIMSANEFQSRVVIGNQTLVCESDTNNILLFSETEAISYTDPTHISFTKSGADVTLFINGSLRNSFTVDPSLTLTTDNFGGQGNAFYNGYLWDVKIYDGSGVLVNWFKCAEGRTDTVAPNVIGDNGTITSTDLSTFRHVDTFGYKV